jgi:hypothetical protein
MKILDVSAVTDSAQIKIKQGTLKFLQDANYEALGSIVQGLIGATYNTSTVYVLNGCKNTGAGSNYIIGGGAVFYNGEIFLVDAASFSISGINVAVCTLAVTQYTTNADPVTFSDLSTHNVHNVRKVLISSGTSGSGLSDYSGVTFLNFTIPAQVNISGTGLASVSGTYPNIIVNVPASSNLNPVLASGTAGAFDPSGGVSYTITGFSVGTSDYYVMGSMVSAGTLSLDANVYWVIKDRTPTQFTLYIREASSGAQSLYFDYILFHK